MTRILLLSGDRRHAGETRSLLRADGHEVVCVRDIGSWCVREREVQPELVVAPVESPEAVMAAHQRGSRSFRAPLLFVQEGIDDWTHPDLRDRLVDRIVSPFHAEELLARVKILARVYRTVHGKPGADPEPQPSGLLRPLSAIRSRREPDRRPPPGQRAEVAGRVAEWSDRRDTFGAGHSERVASFCATMAEELGLPERETLILMRAAALHDVGKIAVPAEILHHEGPLDDTKMRIVRTHARKGASLTRLLDPDESVVKTVLYHHERPDGSGYHGLARDRIPRTASILAVAECFDGMTSSGVGQPLSRPDALEMLRRGKDHLYDGECVDALTERLKPRPEVIPLASIAPVAPLPKRPPGRRRID